MRRFSFATLLTLAVSGCQSTVIQTGASYPAISPDSVQVSFASAPICSGSKEIGLIPQVGSNEFAQDRAINEIKRQAASHGANLVLLDTTETSHLGVMQIDAVLYRCQ